MVGSGTSGRTIEQMDAGHSSLSRQVQARPGCVYDAAEVPKGCAIRGPAYIEEKYVSGFAETVLLLHNTSNAPVSSWPLSRYIQWDNYVLSDLCLECSFP